MAASPGVEFYLDTQVKKFYVTVFWESERGKKKKEPGKLSFEEGE